ncbi:MAG: hypothetical protein J7L52_03645 [Thermotogae bacterium]|nr:hypothetical protein [Thermotogota bacterium]
MFDNKKEGPHWDVMVNLRNEIGGINKIRIDSEGNILGGETQTVKKNCHGISDGMHTYPGDFDVEPNMCVKEGARKKKSWGKIRNG